MEAAAMAALAMGRRATKASPEVKAEGISVAISNQPIQVVGRQTMVCRPNFLRISNFVILLYVTFYGVLRHEIAPQKYHL